MLRILTTQWLAAALRELRAKPELVAACARRTGCAMRHAEPGEGVKLQGLEAKVIDYDDIGSDFGDKSEADDEPGVDGGESDSGAESYGRGADSEDNESLVSTASEASSDEGLGSEAVDPVLLIPHGYERADCPASLQDAIGSRVLVKVAIPKRRTRRGCTEAEVQEWWAGSVVSDTRSSSYAEMRKLGHTLVIHFDEAFRSCGYAGDIPAKKSFYLYEENYGTYWLLYSKITKSQ
eukprot:GHVU01048743.1.p2 GENE.GHVU01048743.1~~GHVU01048743.1.p2  ORF type:complete len:236 (-),score=28.96 GHVU01048743.1:1354-2061(-)